MTASTDRADAPHDDQRLAVLSGRGLAGWEVASVVSSIIIGEWALYSAAGVNRLFAAIPVLLAFALMFLSHKVRGESLRDVGFRWDNIVRALYLLSLPVLAFAVLTLLVGWILHAEINFFRWHSRRYLLVQLVIGLAWGLAQQYVLQGFLNRRAMLLVGRGWRSIILIAIIFGGLHLPNIWVAAITFIGGVAWAAIYQRTPNLFALAISHAVMTWFVVSTLPPSALHHLRVGLRYFG